MKFIVITTLLLFAVSAFAIESLTENVVDRAGIAILPEATGIEPSEVRASNSKDKSRNQQFGAFKVSGRVNKMLVYESLLGKKLEQLFRGLHIPQQVHDAIPALGGANTKHEFLVGSSTDGKLEFTFIRFYPSGTMNGKNLFTIQSLKSSCTMQEFPDTEFALLDGEDISTVPSAASAYKPTARPTLSADEIAHMWKTVTNGLVEIFESDSDF